MKNSLFDSLQNTPPVGVHIFAFYVLQSLKIIIPNRVGVARQYWHRRSPLAERIYPPLDGVCVCL